MSGPVHHQLCGGPCARVAMTCSRLQTRRHQATSVVTRQREDLRLLQRLVERVGDEGCRRELVLFVVAATNTFVVCAKPMNDLRWTCQKNNTLIYRFYIFHLPSKFCLHFHV